MEIKKSLNAAAKRLTPAIEASNTGTQLAQLAARINELLDYAEAKEEKRKIADETGKPFAVRVTEKRDDFIKTNVEQQLDAETQTMQDPAQIAAQPDAG